MANLLGMDSMCHLICTNNFKSSTISIPSPFNQNQIIDLSISKSKNTKNTVSIINGSPYINVDVKLDGIVSSSEYKLDLSDSNNIEIIEKYASSFIKDKILNYLYSTSKDYHVDIAGFGKFLAYDYLTIEGYEKINWPHLYADSFFNVNVEVDITSSYLLVQN